MKRGEGKLGLVAIRLYDRCFICSRALSFDYFAHLSQDSGQTGGVQLHKHISVVSSRPGLMDMK